MINVLNGSDDLVSFGLAETSALVPISGCEQHSMTAPSRKFYVRTLWDKPYTLLSTRKGFVFNWVDTKLFTFISWWAHVPTSSPANNKVLESLPTIRLWYGTMHFGEWQQLGIIFWKMIFLPSKKGSSPFQTMSLQARWASYGKIPNVIW